MTETTTITTIGEANTAEAIDLIGDAIAALIRLDAYIDSTRLPEALRDEVSRLTHHLEERELALRFP
jgi:hypothetical protein